MNESAQSEDEEVPLFPLNTVLFPGGPLPLRIFEARYLDMISECMRGSRPFGVCLITQGNEAGQPADTVSIGTLAEIVDWNQYDDGVLGITARGGDRFRILDRHVAANQLARASIRRLPALEAFPLPDEHVELVKLTRALVERAGPLYEFVKPHYEDGNWIACRLAEMLPASLDLKQALLETDDGGLRLEQVANIVRALTDSAD